MSYPYSVPKEVINTRLAMLSAIGLKSDSLSKSRPRFTVYVVNHRRLGVVAVSDEFSSLDEMLKWRHRYPSNRDRGFTARLRIKIYTATLKVSQVFINLPLITRFVGRQVVEFSINFNTPGLRNKINDGLVSARERISRKKRTSYAKTPRLRNQTVTNTLPWISYSGGTMTRNTRSAPFEQFYRDFVGVTTPHYGALKSLGQLPINGYAVLVRTTNDGGSYIENDWPTMAPGYSSIDINSYTSQFGTSIFGSAPTPSPSHLTRGRNIALSRLIHKAQSDIDANLAQDFAQIGQTTRLITDVIRKVNTSVLALKNGNIPKAVSTLWQSSGHPRFRRNGGPSVSKTVANNWLELQYGWKPLLSDVRGAMEALAYARISNVAAHYIRASAKVEDYKKTPMMFNGLVQVGTNEVSTQTTYKFGIRYAVDDPFVALLQQTGFLNPVNLVWEVLPFSFVVDWFLPIGPLVSGLSAWYGLHFFDGFEINFTRQSFLSCVNFSGHVPGDDPNLTRTFIGDYSNEVVRFERIKLSSFPVANHFPSFKSPFDKYGAHIKNGLALMVSLFKK